MWSPTTILLLLGGGAVVASALGPKKKKGSGGKRTNPKLTLVAVDPVADEVDEGLGSGVVRRSFPANPGGAGIDAREIRIGPIVPEIPEGMWLVVDVELTIDELPPAIPGGAPTPCKSLGAALVYNDAKKEIRDDPYVSQGCVEMRKTGGADYDVRFPDFRLLKAPQGISFAYTWIAFKSEQGPTYYPYAHNVRVRWELVLA